MDAYWGTPVIGGLAGLTADVVTHPISTVKTRMQVQGASKAMTNAATQQISTMYRNPLQASIHMIRHEGFHSFWQGIGAVIGGAPFASALYFAGVEGTKHMFNQYNINNSLANFGCGVAGQLCGSLAWVPMDVLKERCQIQGQIHSNTMYHNSTQAVLSIIRTEGVFGLYRAYFIHQGTWAPFNGCYWMIYEKAKTYFNEKHAMQGSNNFLVSSCIAGTLSSIVTSPLDLVKTRMQVQRANPEMFAFSNSWQCAVRVYQTEGVLAFFDGVIARCCWLTPRYIVAVSLFDVLKESLIVSSTNAEDMTQTDTMQT